MLAEGGRLVFGQALSLEDAETKSSRLEVEAAVLAQAGQFKGALERWNEAIECTPARVKLHEMKVNDPPLLNSSLVGSEVLI